MSSFGLGSRAPGQLRDPVEVGADDVVLGLLAAQGSQPRELAIGDRARLFGQPASSSRFLRVPRSPSPCLHRAPRWMALSCSRRSASRWSLPTPWRTSASIFCFTSRGRFGFAEQASDEAQASANVELVQHLELFVGAQPERRGDLVSEDRGFCSR